MTTRDLPIVILVEGREGVAEDDVRDQLPPERYERVFLRLSDYGAPTLPPTEVPHDIDWMAFGRAVEDVADKVHALQREAKDKRTVVYIAGKAPLAVFVHLGYKFAKSIPHVKVLNQVRSAGAWETYSIDETSVDAEASDPFDRKLGIPHERSHSTGRLGLTVDPSGRPDDTTPSTELIKKNGDDIAGMVRLLRSEALNVTPANMGAIVRQLREILSQAPSFYPDRSGLAIFAACPAQVAVALGRAISATVQGDGDIWLTEWRRPHYEFVYSLPFVPPMEPVIPKTAEAREVRRKVLDEVRIALDDLQKDLEIKHVPTGLLRDEAERKAFVEKVKAMHFEERDIENQPFRIRVAQDRGCLGAGILHAIRELKPNEQQDVAKLLWLHEIVHDWQGLVWSNHNFIGRSGFVLEEIDYFADAFSIQTLVNMELDLDKRTRRNVSASVLRWIEMLQRAIEAFDRMEQGPRIKQLAERRLRRYLLWHVQHGRAMHVKTVEQAQEMLQSALTVELAPLTGYVDALRHEKIVRHAVAEPELCISLEGRLIRVLKMTGHSLAEIVDHIRAYEHEPVRELMAAVVDQNRPKLARWLEAR